MSLLFVARKFPPSKGGMQKAAYELWEHLSSLTEVKLVKWGGSNKWLPLVLPYLLLSSVWVLMSSRVGAIYLQDGLLAPIGCLAKILKKPVVITIHGLDITYKNRWYQMVVPKCVKRMSKVICISESTRLECIRRGIPAEKIQVIPDGVSDQFYMASRWADRHWLREEVSRKLGFDLDNKEVILSVGRLVERKGIHWFVKDVMPRITRYNKDCIYLIVGEGVYEERIREVVEERELKNNVFMLGQVDDEMLKLLFNTADVCVMPNIPIEGDIEGFGLVALEAASCGLPVVASKLEGIKDAVEDGENGFLIDSGDAQAFADVIAALSANDGWRARFGAKARQFSLENFSWEKVAMRYLEEFSRTGSK